MKKIGYYILLLSILILPISIYASGNEVTEVASEIALENCLRDGAVCKLTDDIAIRYTMGSSGETILDLNGHTISPTADMKVNGGFIVVESGSKLTINDTTGNGIITTGASNQNVWAAVQLLKEESTGENAELIVNGGTIEGYKYGIVGNDKRHNTKITINDGIIRGLNQDDSAGIYQPQIGEIIVNGGVIKGGTGIEIRSGSLTVNNGTIEGIAPTFTKTNNENDITTAGVGIAVAQYVTKNPIQVSIQGGDISGQYAFYEWNPHNNSQADLEKIAISITDGNFKSTLSGGVAVYSQNFKKFISGGKFNTEVTEYLVDNTNLAAKITLDNVNISQEETKNNNWIFIIIGGVVIIGISGFILYKRKSV